MIMMINQGKEAAFLIQFWLHELRSSALEVGVRLSISTASC